MDNTPPEAEESGLACPEEQAILRGRPGIFQRNLQRHDQDRPAARQRQGD
ncbi:hypothetical protein ACXDJJ_004341 [Klebsiella quasipneumoniae]